MKTKREVCICVAKVQIGIDKQSKLINIIMNVVKRRILVAVFPIHCIRFGFVGNMRVVYLFDKRRTYTSLENVVFPRIAHICRY